MTGHVYHLTETLPVKYASQSKDQAFAVGGVKGVVETTPDSDNQFVLRLGPARNVVRLTVAAATDDSSPLANGSAISPGDTLYVNMTTHVVSKDSSGTVLFGYALGTKGSGGYYDFGSAAVASGVTAACDVLIA